MVRDRESHGGANDQLRVPRIETYATEVETVIFDGENPLAWIASPDAMPIEQLA